MGRKSRPSFRRRRARIRFQQHVKRLGKTSNRIRQPFPRVTQELNINIEEHYGIVKGMTFLILSLQKALVSAVTSLGTGFLFHTRGLSPAPPFPTGRLSLLRTLTQIKPDCRGYFYLKEDVVASEGIRGRLVRDLQASFPGLHFNAKFMDKMLLQDQARMTNGNGQIPRVPAVLERFRNEIKQPSELDHIALKDVNSDRLLEEVMTVLRNDGWADHNSQPQPCPVGPSLEGLPTRVLASELLSFSNIIQPCVEGQSTSNEPQPGPSSSKPFSSERNLGGAPLGDYAKFRDNKSIATGESDSVDDTISNFTLDSTLGLTNLDLTDVLAPLQEFNLDLFDQSPISGSIDSEEANRILDEANSILE